MRYLICGKVNNIDNLTYRGMDRNGLIWLDVCPDKTLVHKVENICRTSDIKHEEKVIKLYHEINIKGYTKFELLAVDKVSKVNSNCWRLLGFDVGEINGIDGKWSAIFKYKHYTTYEKIKPWLEKLNSNGLFVSKNEASKFRDFYLKSQDPVLAENSKEENERLYNIAKIYVYEP